MKGAKDKMHKDLDSILISEFQLEDIVSTLADEINADYSDEEIIMIVILKGSVVFASDLMRKLKMPVNLEFMKASSYGLGTTSSKVVNVTLDIKTDIEGKNVLLVEDIVDSGNTLSNLKAMLLKRNPKTLKLCTLLDKPDRREAEIEPDYVGTIIPDEFVVGYGLDYAEDYRQLPYIGILSRSVYEVEK